MTKYLPKLPALLLLLGGLLRILGTGASALWYDESVTLYRTTIPFMTLFSNQTDASGDLLLDLIDRPLMAISHSLWMLRLPSLVASLISLWLVWKLMQKLEFNPAQQTITAVAAAALPGLVWIGQDARSYSLVAMFFLAALWFALTDGALGLVACCGLLIYCHTTGAVYAITALLIYAWLNRWNWRRVLLCIALVGLFWTPTAVRILSSMPTTVGSSVMQPWAPRLTDAWTFRAVMQALWTWAPFNTKYFGLASLAIMLATLPLVFSGGKDKTRIVTLLAWTLPPAGICAVSLLWTNVLLYRTLMPVLFAGCLWLGWVLGRKVGLNYSYLMGLAWVCLITSAVMFYNPSARGAGLDQVSAVIRSEWRSGDVIVYETGTVALPFDYYLGDKPYTQWKGITSPFLMEPGLSLPDTGQIATAKRFWLIVPDDWLITPEESARFDAQFPHGSTPLMRMVYLQAAPINVYLEER
jgi:hypothetical protein